MSCTSCLSNNDIQTPDQVSVPCTTPYFHKDTLIQPSSSRSPPLEGRRRGQYVCRQRCISTKPISQLCIASKILEKIIHNKISGYVINYISDSQFGFLQNRSTLQQLLIFFNLRTNQANNKSLVDVIYLDFKKAFDSVSNVKLLEKLWAFGITDNIWHCNVHI